MAKRESAIEIRHLRHFLAAAEHGSFRKAGLSLGVHESTVSRRVRDLEDQIGASLFHRQTGGISLTFAGQRFLLQARIIIRQVKVGIDDAGMIGRSEDGRIRIGIFSSLASGFLTDLIRAYDRRHSRIRIQFVHDASPNHVAAIRKLQLDVAFITGTSTWSGCDATHLWSERIFVVLPAEHRLVRVDELRWADLAGENFIVNDVAPGPEIHDHLVRRLADLGYHPEIELQYVERDNLLPLVALGRGLTLVSEAMTAATVPGIVYRPISGEVLPFSAVWSPKNDNPACRRLLSLARTMAKAQERRTESA